MRAATNQRRQVSHACHTASGAKPGRRGSTAQPHACRRRRPCSQVSRMPGSIGRWPDRSASQPTRTCRVSKSSSDAANRSPPGSDKGTRASYPACTSSNRARSRTLRAIGPSVPNWATQTSCAGHSGTRPWLGRRPNTLFHAAGLRRLPMKSLPSATASMCVASATAAPPLLPPADLAGS